MTCAYCTNPATVPFSWYGKQLLMCETCMAEKPWEQKPEPVLEPPVRNPFNERDFYGS